MAVSVSKLAMIAAVPALVLVAGAAGAQQLESRGPGPMDPIMQEAEFDAGPNHFFINNDQDTEVARFKTPRLVSICAGRGHMTAAGRDKGYPLLVSWDTETAMLAPGNCIAFDAQRVKVRAASRIPQNTVLEGTFKVS